MQRTEETVVFINTNSLLCGTHICKIDQNSRAYNSGSKPVGSSPPPPLSAAGLHKEPR